MHLAMDYGDHRERSRFQSEPGARDLGLNRTGGGDFSARAGQNADLPDDAGCSLEEFKLSHEPKLLKGFQAA